ncbi:hypothetical protein ET445_06165 [Agromyces protaetiae]|uniref:ScoMcrA-like SRA domain-containing protein n=1 Tax=Agromyces protaetiae TaxID=2509455 RepID=A0A4P6FF22_9MICO|nr:hypothetical protein [Agromyces protaetiae]QAY72989.1 hypothetical protein ET445_06165 [Agromyces protaetiae]
MTTGIRLSPGDIVTRSDIAIQYGGSPYSGGIVPSEASRSVFLFTDPSEGTQFGYVYDGFSSDTSVLYYTGAGSDGDQKESGSNSPILTHASKGRTLHAFVAAGRVPGTATKRQRYVGEFVLDPALPYERMPALDKKGALRTVLVFRLLPVSVVPAWIADIVGRAQMPSDPRSQQVPIEINSTQFFETAGSKGALAVRKESQLVDDFVSSQPDHVFSRWAITLPSEHTRLLTDIYDEGDRTLYEAKALSGRSDVRMAVGQLYDYKRHVAVDGLQCSVLLPERPSNDLRDLIQSAGLGVAYRESSGFRIEPSTLRHLQP